MLQALIDTAAETRTENGALAWRTSGSACLDFFASVGAMRNASATDIEQRFVRAYAEDALLAMKILFYARDIRGGLGERRVFRILYAYMMRVGITSAIINLALIPEYGRYDDLIALLPLKQSIILPMIQKQWQEDISNCAVGAPVSLLAKWLPSVNASSRETRRLAHLVARSLGLSPAAYRKSLSALRKRIDLLENRLRERNYTFDYAKQPSKAMLKYRAAFWRNDKDRYEAFLESVQRGEAKLHTGTLYPYELIEPIINSCDRNSAPLDENNLMSLETSWSALPDFTQGEDSIAVIDGSGSMYCGGRPMAASIALSLGLYFAERNHGAFQGYFITFSHTPQLVKVTGNTLRDRVLHAISYNEVANTNIEAVFRLLLDSAVRRNIPPDELPKRIYIISDMEFDVCTEDASITNFNHAQKIFAEKGYELPQVVFWKVDSRHGTQPVRKNEQGAILVSGRSPRLFSMALNGAINPYQAMLDAVNVPRYQAIKA